MGTGIVVVVMLICTLLQTTGRPWYGRIHDAIVTIGVGALAHNGLMRHLPAGFIGESIAVLIALTSALVALYIATFVEYGLYRTASKIGLGRAGKKARQP